MRRCAGDRRGAFAGSQTALLGVRLFAQVIRLDATGLSASNGLELDLGH
jgi:hypothetical protein